MIERVRLQRHAKMRALRAHGVGWVGLLLRANHACDMAKMWRLLIEQGEQKEKTRAR
jgi:hypothetical protein